MTTKQDYIAEHEIVVKNLLSEMYDNESNLLSKIRDKKDKQEAIKTEIKTLQKDYKNQKNLREDLTAKFDDLQQSKSSNWEKFKAEYEMVLDLAEGDKFRFIEKAEDFIEELNARINELEEKVKSSTDKTKKKSQEMLDDLNERRADLQERLNEAKEDSGEVWKEVKHWFMERSKDVRSLF